MIFYEYRPMTDLQLMSFFKERVEKLNRDLERELGCKKEIATKDLIRLNSYLYNLTKLKLMVNGHSFGMTVN